MSAVESDPEDPLAPRSPGLQPVQVRFRPSPTPPPFPQKQEVNSPSTSKIKKSTKRKKPRAGQGDAVLINFMANYNQPEIAKIAAEEALNCDDSASESEGALDEVMQDLDLKLSQQMAAKEQAKTSSGGTDLLQTAQKAVSLLNTGESTSNPSTDPRRDSSGVAKPPDSDVSPTEQFGGLQINGVEVPLRTVSKSSTDGSLISPTDSRKPSLPQGYDPEESLVTSPLSAHLKDPDSPAQKLPAIQHGSPKDGPSSPRTRLPSVVGLIEMADQANENVDALRRRQSSFSVSPTLQFPAQSARSPGGLPPLNHTSPTFTQSDTTSPRDYRSARSPPSATGTSSYFFPPRRASAASETSPPGFAPALASASTSSTDGTSPSTQPTPIETHRMSIDGSASNPIILPPPVPSIGGATNLANAPLPGAAAPGEGFKCEFPGCGAPPFQTQYLLKYVPCLSDFKPYKNLANTA